MGTPSRTTSADVPDFSTYPAAPGDHLLNAAEPNPRLNEVASEVGRRIGEVANRAGDIRERATERMQSMRQSVGEMVSSVRGRSAQLAQEKLDVVMDQTEEKWMQARRYAEANPLVVIAAAGVAGILLGAGARAWRGNRG